MPFFGGKKDKKEKSNEAPNYPRQQAPPPPQVGHHVPPPSYPQGTPVNQNPNEQFFYAPVGPQHGAGVTVAFARNDLPGAYDNWGEGFLDGPSFANRVPDRNIPPAPGSYYFVSTQNTQGPSCSGPPPPQQVSAPMYPAPPTYEEVLSQEVKQKM